MDAIFIELARSVPALLVLGYIVIVFVRHIEKNAANTMQMHVEHLAARSEVGEQLRRNADVLSRLLELFHDQSSDDSDATPKGGQS